MRRSPAKTKTLSTSSRSILRLLPSRTALLIAPRVASPIQTAPLTVHQIAHLTRHLTAVPIHLLAPAPTPALTPAQTLHQIPALTAAPTPHQVPAPTLAQIPALAAAPTPHQAPALTLHQVPVPTRTLPPTTAIPAQTPLTTICSLLSSSVNPTPTICS